MRARFSLAHRLTRFDFVVLAAAALTFAAPACAADLPRYKLKPGMELVYRASEVHSITVGDRPRPRWEFEWTIDVVGPSGAGGWRLLVNEKSTATVKRNGEEHKDERHMQYYFDLDAAGHMSDNRSIQFYNPASQFLPPLPPDETSLASSWKSHLSLHDTTRALAAPDKATVAGTSIWRFVETPRGALDRVYLWSTTREHSFDAKRGLVTKSVTTDTQGWPPRLKDVTTVTTAELVEVRQVRADTLATLATESERLFTACDEADSLTERADHDAFSQAAELYDRAEAKLKDLDGKLTVETLKHALAIKLKSLTSSRKDRVESAEKYTSLIGKPSPEWETTDLDGKPRKLSDYRGKVVLMDFWYRGCGWCIRSMPQLKQLASDFDGQQFALLGMNNDDDLADARFVIDALELPYENLKNSLDDKDPINKKYEARGWPTLVLLDGKGVIRHIHVGYSANLREELAAKIRELLAEK